MTTRTPVVLKVLSEMDVELSNKRQITNTAHIACMAIGYYG